MAHAAARKSAQGSLLALLVTLVMLAASVSVQGALAQSQMMQSYQELFERSQQEKKGLTFYVRGQTISGVVVKLTGMEAVEIRNQTYGRIIIRLESIDALAIN